MVKVLSRSCLQGYESSSAIIAWRLEHSDVQYASVAWVDIRCLTGIWGFNSMQLSRRHSGITIDGPQPSEAIRFFGLGVCVVSYRP